MIKGNVCKLIIMLTLIRVLSAF